MITGPRKVCGCRVKPSVLDVVATHLRLLSSPQSRSVCIHARVADDIALFANYDGVSSRNQTLLDPKRIWRQQEHLFKCAQVRVFGVFGVFFGGLFFWVFILG